MKGDFSRDTFDPAKHFSRVLMQQGRVQLDADWNEQNAILLHYLRTLAKDILGPYAGPKDESGFDIITAGSTETQKKKIYEFVPEGDRRTKLLNAIKSGADIVISPGRYYVEGILVENERAMLYSEQLSAESKNHPPLAKDIEKPKQPLLFYLDVWERHITYIEDGHIREGALGGADTCSRSQVVWQVKFLKINNMNRETITDAIDGLRPVRAGKLMARTVPDKPRADDFCVISPDSRYRGAENQLYRVEVHRGGKATSGATFKWSRENGSVIFPISTINDTKVKLEHLGRDQKLSLKPGDWVEFMDEKISMSPQAGPLAKVEVVDRAELTVTVSFPLGEDNSLPSYDKEDAIMKLRPYLRRWDHIGDAKKFGGALQVIETPPDSNDWIELEDSVQVKFPTAESDDRAYLYRTGDYWLIPARVAIGEVEWPSAVDENGESSPAAVEPHGPRHYYAPLAKLNSPIGNPVDVRSFINELVTSPEI